MLAGIPIHTAMKLTIDQDTVSYTHLDVYKRQLLLYPGSVKYASFLLALALGVLLPGALLFQACRRNPLYYIPLGRPANGLVGAGSLLPGISGSGEMCIRDRFRTVPLP